MIDREEISNFFIVLVEDCSTAGKLWHQHNDGYTKRSYVRAFFAFVEGNTYRMKQLCIYAHNNGKYHLSDKDLEKAMEIKMDIHGNEKIIKIKTLDNVKLSFSLFSKVFGIENTLDTSGTQWNNFRKALDIRHRLTHPKSPSDFNLCHDDMLLIEKSAKFYRDSTLRLIGT